MQPRRAKITIICAFLFIILLSCMAGYYFYESTRTDSIITPKKYEPNNPFDTLSIGFDCKLATGSEGAYIIIEEWVGGEIIKQTDKIELAIDGTTAKVRVSAGVLDDWSGILWTINDQSITVAQPGTKFGGAYFNTINMDYYKDLLNIPAGEDRIIACYGMTDSASSHWVPFDCVTLLTDKERLKNFVYLQVVRFYVDNAAVPAS